MKLQIGRRGFLGLLGAAAGWLATKPMRALVSTDAPAPIAIDVTKVTIGQWATYWPPPEGLLAAHYQQALATSPADTGDVGSGGITGRSDPKWSVPTKANPNPQTIDGSVIWKNLGVPLPTPKTEPVYFFYHPLGGSD